MTATTSTRFAPEYMTEAVAALLANVSTGRRDVLPILADALDDAGYADAAELAAMRAGTWQITEEGDRVVTVGRDGADHDRHGNGIYTTKTYTAARRRRDGLLTWRLTASVSAHRTSGKAITGPMLERAKSYAAGVGLTYRSGIIHGAVCR